MSLELEQLRGENARLKHALSACIPWLASHGRGMAQEALADACLLIGAALMAHVLSPDKEKVASA